MYSRVKLRLSDSEHSACEFFDRIFGQRGQVRSGPVLSAKLERAVTDLASREAV